MKINLLSVLVFCIFINIGAQNRSSPWHSISSENAKRGQQLARKSQPKKASYFQLDIEKLKTLLTSAQKSSSKQAANVNLEFPNSEGVMETFSIKESSILEPDFQAKHPDIRTYIGQNTNNPASTITFSLTPNGLHAMTFSAKNGVQFIDPYLKDSSTYIAYNKGDLPSLKKGYQCLVDDSFTVSGKSAESAKLLNANDGKLRTFRLALACTVEYSEFHWTEAGLSPSDSEADKKEAVLSAMVTTMNRVNAIFQRDLAIKMVMVDNTDIIFIDSDDFDNYDAATLLDQSQTVINSTILPENYDIGHTFGTGNDGYASVSSTCVDSRKAMGITGSSTPVGDAYDIDYVAHEMGHQFGATHTFNGNAGNCSGNRTASSAYEPGSGSTIMAYAGICSSQNIQQNSDAYFHQNSIQMIWENITTGYSTCATEISTGNSAPTADAGPDYTIPISTPFKLTGSSTDPDGTSTHTYTWEQYDLGPAGIPEETNTSGPLFRSFEGTDNPVRYIPNFSDYLATNGSTDWEKLPAVNRTLNFTLTVRDNDVSGSDGGGQTAVDYVKITVNSTEPFTVSNPVSWAQNTTQTVEWNVGQTADPSTINCQLVNIKLSTDGGNTFPITLASNTENDGSYSFTVPSITDTSTARILVEAADNIFYDISDFDFSISDTPNFFITETSLSPINCGDNSAVFTFNFTTANGFSENTTFSAVNIPSGATVSFSPSSTNHSETVTMTIENLDAVAQGDYEISIRGTSASFIKDTEVDFSFYNTACSSSGNLDYDTSITGVQFNTIDATSGKTGYTNNTSMITNCNRESSYDLSVYVNTDGPYTTNTKVWIDWNQNCSFDDPWRGIQLGRCLQHP